MLDAIFERHQQRIHVFKALELRLVDLLDDALVVGRQVHRFVGELWWEVRQVLSITLKAQISFDNISITLRHLSPDVAI